MTELNDGRAWMTFVAQLATQLRADAIRCSTQAGSGHPTSSMSAADLMAVLLARHLRYHWDQPDDPDNDHFILSKGHASPLLYAAFKAAGVITDTELMSGYRQLGSRLQGHPTPVLPWVDVASGSLGQGIGNGVGVALAGKFLDKSPFHVWVLCGDSETAEGSVWEALDKAGYYGLANFTVIVDVNRLGQRGPTELGWDLASYARRVEAFGAKAITIDGHDLDEIDRAFTTARETTTAPTVILAKTIKGRGFREVEDREGWHGTALPPDMARRALAELGHQTDLSVTGLTPAPRERDTPRSPADAEQRAPLQPSYTLGDKVATRAAYGTALVALAQTNHQIVAMDAEVSNSTRAAEFAHRYPDRYFEMFIAEQQLVASAVGLSVRHYIPFASTFAAFLTRAHDFIRMAAISRANICLVGSHAGVEIGADGPSQMALEDLAMMRSVHGATVLYPSDATSTAALVHVMADARGIRYLRTTRGAYPVLYDPATTFTVGGSQTVRSSDDDQVALIGAGVTVHQCVAAAESLHRDGIAARVIDMYSIKPIDVQTLSEAVRDTRGRLVVAEDHHPEGGLGSAVLEALAELQSSPLRLVHLAVRAIPGSGTPAELLANAEIDGPSIERAARHLLDRTNALPVGHEATRLPAPGRSAAAP
ncbi:transketolase [Mycobacterium intracellulare]|uniref:Transketolase n=2 Tax=Mycobacterium intracellulare TaxID=1767 RepID=A0AAE4RFR2_MYCIT|nr:transketolase [Mycobacterium intracellulare]MDV6979371.1 transketolase [Mycobacterium intracellulare]MDV6984786.1 transketolase [Mycobacterium intracellulare]MDV7014890.1 transketolase [Mycobacterium intracellulare]